MTNNPHEKCVYISDKKFNPYVISSQNFLHCPKQDHFEKYRYVLLVEYVRETGELTGRTLTKIIQHVQDLNDGYVILGFVVNRL